MSPTTSWIVDSGSSRTANPRRSDLVGATGAQEEPPVAQREKLLTETFVTLADTMVKDFDVVDFLSMLSRRCIDLFDAGEAGLMLADAEGHMQLAASSSHEMRVLELLEIQHDQGPCPDAYRTGAPVQSEELRDATARWPHFAPDAVAAGYRSALALPMRLRDETIGALNLLRVEPGALPDDDIAAAQALADVATIGILHHRAAAESHLLSEQLQYALNSRVIIEQAKGAIAQKLDLNTDEAFSALRRYSRNNNQRLVDTATAIVERTLDAATITAP
jgi:GAF domain-containing protein